MTNIKKVFKQIALLGLFLSGIILLLINTYGLSQDIRAEITSNQGLRFKNDFPEDYNKTITLIEKKSDESDIEYARRVNSVISRGLAHIQWLEYEPEKFNQIIPIWENYFIYFMGKLSNIPEYQRYHYADYRRSLKRGIGICGDASMVLSQTLEKESIDNKIVSFPGHVVTRVNFSDGKEFTYDPDFGVVLPYSINEIQLKPSIVVKHYVDKGYTKEESISLAKIYAGELKVWDGVSHFITKKYYFEKIAYALKWPLPIALVIYPIIIFIRYKKTRPDSTRNL